MLLQGTNAKMMHETSLTRIHNVHSNKKEMQLCHFFMFFEEQDFVILHVLKHPSIVLENCEWGFGTQL